MSGGGPGGGPGGTIPAGIPEGGPVSNCSSSGLQYEKEPNGRKIQWKRGERQGGEER